MTTIKAVYGDDTRRLNIQAGTTLSALQEMLKDRFNLATVSLKWVDEDGDYCTLAEDDDLTEALRSTNKLRIIVNGTAGEPSPSTTPADLPKAAEKEERKQQRSPATPCGLFKLLQHFKQPCANATTDPAEHPFAGMIRGAMQHAAKAAQEAAEKATAEAEKAAADAKDSPTSTDSSAVHLGVSCDVSGQCPIVGVRYHKRGANYDLCQAEFDKLSPEDQGAFEAIHQPRIPFCGRGPFGFPFPMADHGAAEAGGFPFPGAIPAHPEGQGPPVHFLEMIQRAAAVAEEAAAEAATKVEKEAAENPDTPPEALSFAQSITQAVQQAAKAAQKAAAEAAEKAAKKAAEKEAAKTADMEAAPSPPAYEEDGDTAAEFPTVPAEAQEEVLEQALEEVASASSVNPVSMEDAISALGVGEDVLSASIMHEIQYAVNVNAEEAERRITEESAAEAERKAREETAAQRAEEERLAAETAEAEEKAAAEAAAQREAEEKAAAEAAAQTAEAEAKAAAEAAAQREAEEKAAAEAAAQREAEEKAAAEAAAQREAEAKAAAEAAAQREAEEKAAAEAAAQREAEEKAVEQAVKDAESQERAALLLQMGFSEEQVQGALEATQGSLERAADWLFVNVPQTEPEEVKPAETLVVEPMVEDVLESAFPEEWEQLAVDLEEMGFNAEQAKEQLVKAEGNFKLAIKALVEAERGAM